MNKIIKAFFCILIVMNTVALSWGESIKSDNIEKLPNDFASLRVRRENLRSKIDKLQYEEIPKSNYDAQDFDYYEKQINFLNSELARLNYKKNLTDWEQSDIHRYKGELNRFSSLFAEAKKSNPKQKLKDLNEELSKAKDEHSNVENRINELLSIEIAQQNFKKAISMTFAALVALVIVGFFCIAAYDPKVRQTIFSGQAGIQFLTLFSLVIAIILFGITDILGGKELSALLGGISGYILGRSVAGQNNSSATQGEHVEGK